MFPLFIGEIRRFGTSCDRGGHLAVAFAGLTVTVDALCIVSLLARRDRIRCDLDGIGNFGGFRMRVSGGVVLPGRVILSEVRTERMILRVMRARRMVLR